MGIQGLLPLLKEIQVHGEIKEFKGKTLAVDAYVWLHKGAFGCAEALVKGQKTTKFVDYAMHRVRMLKYHGITPFIVFDGGPLPAKKGTEVSRAKSRAENLARAQALESQGQHRVAREFYTKCVDITPEMAYQLIKALRAENVDYIVAPYEADAQLCYLERNGFVDGIITEDSDLLVFGCRQVIFKLDNDGKCVWIHRDKLAQVPSAPMHGWTETEFRRMAMLSGCDYLDSIQGIGIKKAHALMRRHKTVEKVLSNIRMEGVMRVPPNYVQNFNQAELAFLHQRVFDPVHRKLVPLHDFPESGLQDEDERWIGLDLPIAIARGIARGDLHPETREPIEDHWPDFKPGAGGLSGKGATALKETNKANVKMGPIDGFFKRTKAPAIALPTPVGASGSGVKSLSDLHRPRTEPSATDASSSAASCSQKKPKTSKFFVPPRVALEDEVAKQAEEMHWESSQAPELPDHPTQTQSGPAEESAPDVESQGYSLVSQPLPAGPSRAASIRRSSPAQDNPLSSPAASPSPMKLSLHLQSHHTPEKQDTKPFKVDMGPLSSPVALSSPVSSEAAIFSSPHLKHSRSPSPRHVPSLDPRSSPTPFQCPVFGAAHDDDHPKSSSSAVSRIAESIYSEISIIRLSEASEFKVRISSDSAEDETIVTPSAPEALSRRKATVKGKRSISTPMSSFSGLSKSSGLGKRSASDSILSDRQDSNAKGKRRKTAAIELAPAALDEDDIHLTDPEDDEEVLLEKAREEERAATAARISAGWKEKYSFACSPSASSITPKLGKRAYSTPNENKPQWSVTKSTTPQPLSASMPKILAPISLNAPSRGTPVDQGIRKAPAKTLNATPRRAFSAGGVSTLGTKHGGIPSSNLPPAQMPFSTPAPHTPAGAQLTAGGGEVGGGLGRFMCTRKVVYNPRQFG